MSRQNRHWREPFGIRYLVCNPESLLIRLPSCNDMWSFSIPHPSSTPAAPLNRPIVAASLQAIAEQHSGAHDYPRLLDLR